MKKIKLSIFINKLGKLGLFSPDLGPKNRYYFFLLRKFPNKESWNTILSKQSNKFEVFWWFWSKVLMLSKVFAFQAWQKLGEVEKAPGVGEGGDIVRYRTVAVR